MHYPHRKARFSSKINNIEAMGGELEIIARFPNGDVKIANFTQI
jgi:hypothetical protein